jgi:hypothetical protein
LDFTSLEQLRQAGAFVNDQYSFNHATFWKKHDKSYLGDLVTNLGVIVAGAFGGVLGRGVAEAGLCVLGLSENKSEGKDNAK